MKKHFNNMLLSVLFFMLNTTVFMLIPISHVQAEGLCDFVFRKNQDKLISPDLELIPKINRLEELTNKVRKIRSKNEEEFVLLSRKFTEEFKLLEGLLFKGETDLAIRKWRTLFRKVESSALEADNYAGLINAVKKTVKSNVSDLESFLIQEGVSRYLVQNHLEELYRVGPQKYLKVLHKKLRKYHRELGNNFDQYKLIKKNLDDLAKSKVCNNVCLESLKSLHREIGIASQSQRQMYQHLVQNQRSIKLARVEKIFNSHPEAIVISRRKEFVSESLGLIKKYISQTNQINRLYNKLGNLAAEKKLKIVRLFKRIFDKRYHSLNKGIINKVSYSGLTSKDQLKLIKAESAFSDYQGILVDMSRSTDQAVKETWSGLKEYASSTPNRSGLLNELNQAQQLGEKIGKTSNRLPKDLSTLIGALIVSGSAVGYMLYDVEDEAINEEDDERDEVLILNNDDIDQIQTDEDVIILKYKSDLDVTLREFLLEVADSLAQVEENMSSQM